MCEYMVKSPTSAVFSVMAVVCTIGNPRCVPGLRRPGCPNMYAVGGAERRISRQSFGWKIAAVGSANPVPSGSWSSP